MNANLNTPDGISTSQTPLNSEAKQGQILAGGSSVTTEVVNVNNKVSNLKLVLYFLIGLLTSIFGTIVASIWILLKVKENKKQRFVALGLGLLLSIFIQIVLGFLSPIITEQIQSAAISRFPELKELAVVQTTLGQEYPGSQFSLSLNKDVTSSLKNGSNTTSTTVVVTANNRDLSGGFRRQIGISACKLLTDKNVSFDNLKVTSTETKNIIPIININTYQSVDEVHTCTEWQNNPAVSN